MTGFMPGESPPEVRIAIFFIAPLLLANSLENATRTYSDIKHTYVIKQKMCRFEGEIKESPSLEIF
jgi:hypothetical protein